MKMSLSAIVIAAGASALMAQEAAKPAAAKPAIQVQAEVVSVDAQARTMVVKPSGTSQDQARATLSVETKAAAALQGLHQGDAVTLTCRPSGDAGGASYRQDAGAGFAKACGMVTGIAQSTTH